jgi:hypothetical protein
LNHNRFSGFGAASGTTAPGAHVFRLVQASRRFFERRMAAAVQASGRGRSAAGRWGRQARDAWKKNFFLNFTGFFLNFRT